MKINTCKHTSMGESFYVIHVVSWNRKTGLSGQDCIRNIFKNICKKLRVSVSSHLIHVSLTLVCLEVIVFQLIAVSQNTHKCTQEGLTFDWHEPQSRAKPGNTKNKCDMCYFQLLKKQRTTESYELLPLNRNNCKKLDCKIWALIKKRNEYNLFHDQISLLFTIVYQYLLTETAT